MLLTASSAWAQTFYTLTLYDNYEGGGSRIIPSIESGATITLNSTLTPTRAGHTFLGWSENSTAPATHAVNESITITGNLTLYGIWEDTPYALSGSCGTNVTWAVTKSTGSDDYDVLTISGTGAMNVYGNVGDALAPWIKAGHSSTIKTIVIGDGVTSIGACAFFGCTSLTSVTIPASVTSIGNFAFSGCSVLTSVTVYATAVPTLGTGVFKDNAPGRKIYVFKDREDAYETTTKWSDYANDIEPITLGVNDAGGTLGKWTTYYNGLVDVTVPATTTVYKATYNSVSGNVELTATGSQIIKKGEAVLLKSTADIELSSAASSGTGDYSGNDLHGVDVQTTTASIKTTLGDGTFYVLGNTNSHFGFHKYTGATMPARKAFLLLNGDTALSLNMEIDDETTSLSEEFRVESGEFATAEGYYDLSGRRVMNPTKGLYIVNGKKVIKR